MSKVTRLEEMFNSLFRWCTTPYARDIDRYLKQKDAGRKKLLFRSPQEKYRANLIDWLRSVSEKQKLSTVTVHLAVRLIDTFMDDHNVSENRLAPICLICLLLAAKFEEEDSRIPKIRDLPNLVNGETTTGELICLERFVLRSFDWDVSMITAAHFAEYYSLFAIVTGDKDRQGTSHFRLQSLVQASMNECLDLSLTDVYMSELTSSEVAASCLLAARLELGILPVWPRILSDLTGYPRSALQSCVNSLIVLNKKYCMKKKPKDSPSNESGYESCSPENSHKKRKIEYKK